MVHALDFKARLDDHGQGRWALVDKNVLKRINEHTLSRSAANPALRGVQDDHLISSGRSR